MTMLPAAMVAPRSPTNRPRKSLSLSWSTVMSPPDVPCLCVWHDPRGRPSRQRQGSVNGVGVGRATAYRAGMLRVQLLGEVTAARDGEPVPLSAPHRRLLAFLALHPGPHDRDVLAARFWPDASAARANLRTAVWALRRSLGADAVLASRTTVALA